MADPGFTRQGMPTYYFGLFPQKMHEIKKWSERGRVSRLLAPFHLGPPMQCIVFWQNAPRKLNSALLVLSLNPLGWSIYSKNIPQKRKKQRICLLLP